MMRVYFILFLLIVSAVDSRVLHHRTLSKHSLVLKETERDPNIQKILEGVPEGIIPKLLQTFAIWFSVVISKQLDLYKEDILGLNMATITLQKDSRLDLFFDTDSITLSSKPPFTLSVPGPDFQMPYFRYRFENAEFEAAIEGGWTFRNIGIRHAILKHAIESYFNSEIKSKLPEKVRRAGYRLENDPDKLGTLNELRESLNRISSTHDSDSNLPPITLNDLKDPNAGFRFEFGTEYAVPIPVDNYRLVIPQGAFLFVSLRSTGSLTAPRLKDLTIKTLGRPRIGVRAADDTTGIKGLEFNEIVIRPNAQIHFDYQLGIEEFTSDSIDIIRYILRRLGHTTDASPANVRLRLLRERLDSELQSVREALVNIVRQYSVLIPGYNLVDFFSIEDASTSPSP